jgi:hypothetical protein
MTDVGNNGMFEETFVTRALDLDGATVEEAGPEDPPAGEFPERDVDGSLVGSADAEADEAASRGESI